MLLAALVLAAAPPSVVGAWSLEGLPFAEFRADGTCQIVDERCTWVARDDVLTIGTEDGASDVTTTPRVVRVSAQQRWTDTGVDVRGGDELTFDSRGRVQLSGDSNDVATPAGSQKPGRVMPATNVNAPAGALIARIGDSTTIVVGDRRSIRAPSGGRLYLGLNDDHLPDNNGEFEVTVGIQRRATRRY